MVLDRRPRRVRSACRLTARTRHECASPDSDPQIERAHGTANCPLSLATSFAWIDPVRLPRTGIGNKRASASRFACCASKRTGGNRPEDLCPTARWLSGRASVAFVFAFPNPRFSGQSVFSRAEPPMLIIVDTDHYFMTPVIGITITASATLLCAQNSGLDRPAREFEVSSVKAAPQMRAEFTDSSGQQHTLFQFAPGGRLVVRNGTLRFLLTTAFSAKDFQLIGVPSWADTDRYDIEAKAATDISPDGMLPLVQSLLTERFELAYHRETRELPVYRLVVGRSGQKLKEHAPGNCRMPGEPDIAPDPINVFANLPCGRLNFLRPARLLGGMVRISPQLAAGPSLGGRQSLSTTLADGLSSRVDRIVVDQTGLQGTYDIDLRWSPESSDAGDSPGPSIFGAVQEQLGLRLEPTRGPVEVLVIDRVKKPSEN